jgi:hypothetical protein
MTFKQSLEESSAALKQVLQRDRPLMRQALIDGAVAGVVAVPDIRAGDQLVSVIESAVTSALLTDRTAEFVANCDPGWIVRADGFIDNTSGTATDTDKLLVTWLSRV